MELIIVVLFFMIATPVVAAAKGRSVFIWLVLGLLLPLLSFILVAVLPSVRARTAEAAPRPADPYRGMQPINPPRAEQERVPCPHCAELILPEAKKCRFCGEAVDFAPAARESAKPQTPASSPGIKCSRCGKLNAADALDCQYCGQWLRSRKRA